VIVALFSARTAGDAAPIATRGWTSTLKEIGVDLGRRALHDRLLTYAAAIAFQGLVALVPLALLGLGLLGVLGLEDTWRDSVAPAIEKRVTRPVFTGIDHTVKQALDRGSAGLVALAAALSLWYLSAAARTITEALNQIHQVEDDRRWWHRRLTSVGLAITAGTCLTCSVLATIAAPRAAEHGFGHVVLGLGRWVAAVVLLWLAVTVLIRYAPAEHPQPRWASAGSALVIGAWIIATLIFRWYVSSVADFHSPVRSLTALLVLNGYLFTTAMILLLGVELDESLRKRVSPGGARRRTGR
jgi:membrane protein